MSKLSSRARSFSIYGDMAVHAAAAVDLPRMFEFAKRASASKKSTKVAWCVDFWLCSSTQGIRLYTNDVRIARCPPVSSTDARSLSTIKAERTQAGKKHVPVGVRSRASGASSAQAVAKLSKPNRRHRCRVGDGARPLML